jgi:tRNA threonylcarbamoyladenosine biosynthesis protein TsaE
MFFDLPFFTDAVRRGVICETADDTKNFARKFAKAIPVNSSVALIGDLGSGKTTFVKGMAMGFGVGINVGSPSFNIFNAYEGDVTLLHVDAYRLDGSQRATDSLMIDDFLIPPYCLVVEWPELLHDFLNRCDFTVHIGVRKDFSREIFAKSNRVL